MSIPVALLVAENAENKVQLDQISKKAVPDMGAICVCRDSHPPAPISCMTQAKMSVRSHSWFQGRVRSPEVAGWCGETCSGPGEGQEAKTNRSELSCVTPSARSNVDSVIRRARFLGHTARACSLRCAHGCRGVVDAFQHSCFTVNFENTLVY